MPAIQRGQAYRLGSNKWGLRYYDKAGGRRRKSPFPSKSAALTYYRDVIEPELRGGRRGKGMSVGSAPRTQPGEEPVPELPIEDIAAASEGETAKSNGVEEWHEQEQRDRDRHLSRQRSGRIEQDNGDHGAADD